MKKIALYPFSMVALLLAFQLFAGCAEPPDACYTPSANLVDVNTEVSFENCTEPVAQSYEWDFGDGTTSSNVNPVHIFTAEGQYLVALNAKGKTRSNDNTFKTLITAGQRIMSLAKLTALAATNPTGGAWDAGDNADIAVRFSKDGTTAYQTPTRIDAPWTFPMAIQMPATDFVLTPDIWTITVLDIDGTGEEVMATFAIDFENLVPTDVLTYAVTQGDGGLQINYTLR